MILKLLNKNNRLLLKIEAYETFDTHVCKSFITIPYYSDLLLSYSNDYQMKETFIKSMHYFNTVEDRFASELKNNSREEFNRALKILIETVKEASSMFELIYTED